VHTTIVLTSGTSYLAASGSNALVPGAVKSDGATNGVASKPAKTREAEVSSAPVLMYEETPEVVVYATTYAPADIPSKKHGDYYYWVPGATTESSQTKLWTAAAIAMEQPTANSTVITYTTSEQTIYLTNEAPAPGIFSEPADQLFVWIPGVEDPSDAERQLIASVIEAHQAGGKDALDREVRKLEKDREPPPQVEGDDEGEDEDEEES